MASFLMEDFVGDGSLKDLVPNLLEEGWDDVPTLKLMNAEDMDGLHDRALMQYANKLEASGKGLPELLNLTAADLSIMFGMRRGHIARFDRTKTCAMPVLNSSATVKHMTDPSRKIGSFSMHSPSINRKTQSMPRYGRKASSTYDFSVEQSLAELKIKDGHVFKGIVASMPPEPRACGCIEPPRVVADVAPLSAIESISVQKLTPEYRVGTERLIKTKTTPPMKASELWRDKTAVILCLRRPGCIMCRAEAHRLYSKKPIFDALGVQLYAIIHEYIETEVKDFWPRYWGGAVVYDRGLEFFKALGGGKLLKDKFILGFLLNPQARANYKRAKATGIEQNFKGEGEIKGGLFIVGRGKTGIAYQFVERNFGDWAPLPEVLEICSRLKNQQDPIK